MTGPVINQTNANDLLARVQEGMDVYDRDGQKLGTVNDVYAGDEADTPWGVASERGNARVRPGGGMVVADMARAFGDSLPEVLRSRLNHNGFIRVKGGLLSRDRFALREQVEAVEGKRVVLGVRGEELIHA